MFELTDTGFVVCYARGTMIRTPHGELPIEKLRRGQAGHHPDRWRGRPQTVTWLGHRRISLAGHPRPQTVAPIRIERDAIADDAHRDLLVSPDHAIFVDGMLICARQLMGVHHHPSGARRAAVDYLPRRVGRACHPARRGVASESYLDTGQGFFANSGAPLAPT